VNRLAATELGECYIEGREDRERRELQRKWERRQGSGRKGEMKGENGC